MYRFTGALAWGIGHATVRFDGGGEITGFDDNYNFNRRPFFGPSARDSVLKEVLTRVGDFDRRIGARPYEISLCM